MVGFSFKAKAEMKAPPQRFSGRSSKSGSEETAKKKSLDDDSDAESSEEGSSSEDSVKGMVWTDAS